MRQSLDVYQGLAELEKGHRYLLAFDLNYRYKCQKYQLNIQTSLVHNLNRGAALKNGGVLNSAIPKTISKGLRTSWIRLGY